MTKKYVLIIAFFSILLISSGFLFFSLYWNYGKFNSNTSCGNEFIDSFNEAVEKGDIDFCFKEHDNIETYRYIFYDIKGSGGYRFSSPRCDITIGGKETTFILHSDKNELIDFMLKRDKEVCYDYIAMQARKQNLTLESKDYIKLIETARQNNNIYYNTKKLSEIGNSEAEEYLYLVLTDLDLYLEKFKDIVLLDANGYTHELTLNPPNFQFYTIQAVVNLPDKEKTESILINYALNKSHASKNRLEAVKSLNKMTNNKYEHIEETCFKPYISEWGNLNFNVTREEREFCLDENLNN